MWTYVRGAIGTGDVSCAISLNGLTVYACDRTTGVVRSLGFPALSGGGTTVYTEPSGYDLTSVLDTSAGPLVVLCAHTDGHGELRDFADNVLHTTGSAAATNSVRGSYDSVADRVWLFRQPSSSAQNFLYSMDPDGSNVVTEYDNNLFGTGGFARTKGALTTPDGALWYPKVPSAGTGRFVGRFDGATPDVIGASIATESGIAHHPTNPLAVLHTRGSAGATTVEEATFDGSVIVEVSAGAHVFDGFSLVQSSATPNFRRAVAFGESSGTYAWWVFDLGRRWWVGVAGWSG